MGLSGKFGESSSFRGRRGKQAYLTLLLTLA
jgi:hypothetical protein